MSTGIDTSTNSSLPPFGKEQVLVCTWLTCTLSHTFLLSPSLSLVQCAQAENRETGVLAALKRVPIQDETELEDFMVEIDILTECKHPNIVGLYQAFFHDSALWVRGSTFTGRISLFQFLHTFSFVGLNVISLVSYIACFL